MKQFLLSTLFIFLVAIPAQAQPEANRKGLRIQDEGTNLTIRNRLNFIGAAITCVDSSANNRTECTDSAGANADITSVGDVASGAAFDGTQGTILTFFNASGNQTFSFDNTTQDFELSNDLTITDANPHLRFIDSTPSENDFEIYADNSFLYVTSVTNNIEILKWSEATNILKLNGRYDIRDQAIINPSGAALMTVIGNLAFSGFSTTATNALDKLVAINNTTGTTVQTATRAFVAVNTNLATASSAAKIMGFNAFAYQKSTSPLTLSTLGGGLIGGRMGVRTNDVNSTGTVTMATGLSIANQALGNPIIEWTTLHGLLIEGLGFTNSTIINNYGIKIDALTGATVTTNYGLFVSTMSVGTTRWGLFIQGDPSSFGGDITLADAKNFILGSTTGNKIGTATTQKIGFWNASPVIQPATTGTVIGHTQDATGTAILTDKDTFTGNTGASAYMIGDIVKALKDAGIMAP